MSKRAAAWRAEKDEADKAKPVHTHLAGFVADEESRRPAPANPTKSSCRKKRTTSHPYNEVSPGGSETVVREFASPSGRTGEEVETTTPGGKHTVFHEKVASDASPSTAAKAEQFNKQRDKNARKKAKKAGQNAPTETVTATEPVSREEARRRNTLPVRNGENS